MTQGNKQIFLCPATRPRSSESSATGSSRIFTRMLTHSKRGTPRQEVGRRPTPADKLLCESKPEIPAASSTEDRQADDQCRVVSQRSHSSRWSNAHPGR